MSEGTKKLIRGKQINFAGIEDCIAYTNGLISLEEVEKRYTEYLEKPKKLVGTFTVTEVSKKSVVITVKNEK